MVTADHGKPRWATSKDAMGHMTKQIERLAPYGITLWMFSSPHAKYTGLRTSESVGEVFCKEKPGGATDLSGVLASAFEDHFLNCERTYLVITDGEPSSYFYGAQCIPSDDLSSEKAHFSVS